MKEGQNYNHKLEYLLKRDTLHFINFINALPKTEALRKLNIFDEDFLNWVLVEIAEPRQERYFTSLLTIVIEKKKRQKPHKEIFKRHLKIYTNGSARSGTKDFL